MGMVDWPLEQLESYVPPLSRPADFEAFWATARRELHKAPVEGELERLAYPCDPVEVFRLLYRTWGGAQVHGWYLLPAPCLRAGVRVPAVVVFPGYGGSRGRVSDHLHWVLQGCAVLAVDVRGQSGDTPDHLCPTGGQMPGYMTRGILDPDSYYYRAAYLDALRAIEWLRTRSEVDPARIVATGASQGGGLALAAAALDGQLAAAMPEVPYLSHFRRAVDQHLEGPYREISEYLRRRPENVEQVFSTLNYFDVMNLAPDIRCPVLCSVALQDVICPPSTIYAAFHHLGGPKEMRVYPYNGHGDTSNLQTEEKYRFLRAILGSARCDGTGQP